MSDDREDAPASLDVTRRAFLARATVAGVAAAPLLPDRARAGEEREAPAALSAAAGAARGRGGLLYPQQNLVRNLVDLSGLWEFQLDPKEEGEAGGWFRALPSPRTIAVPCSWNELFDDAKNYLGLAWYRTERWVPAGWRGQRVFLRVGSANYAARVWVNGHLVTEHLGGHLPFVAEITPHLVGDRENVIAIAVENKQLPERVPAGPSPAAGLFSGFMGSYPAATYDFFPYAGLHRPVLLFSVPPSHIDDVTVVTTLEGSDGLVTVKVVTDGTYAGRGKAALAGASAELLFRDGTAEATLRVPSARLWSPQDPHLYPLEVSLTEGRRATDSYRLDIGIRTVEVRGDRLLLNGQPIQLTGFGKHEDFPINGRGLNVPLLVRDHELLRWVGANSYRTSHYPYSEEAMALADKLGVLIIDEIPAVSLNFGDSDDLVAKRKAQCTQQLRELVARDKNHPSVILWCVANEPMAGSPSSPAAPPPRRSRRDALLHPHVGGDAPAGRDSTGDPGRYHGRTLGMARALRRHQHQPLLRLVLPGRAPRPGGAGAREGTGRPPRVVRQAHPHHRIRRRHRRGRAQPARGDVDGGVPGGVLAGLPGRRGQETVRGRPARLELRRFQDRAGHHPDGRDEPEGRLHPRPSTQDGRALPPLAVGSPEAEPPIPQPGSAEP